MQSMTSAPPVGSASTLYETCLFGSITGSESFRAVFDRLTLNTDSSSPFHWREVTFEPLHKETNSDDTVTITCRKDLLKSKSGWILCTHAKPEPVRLYPDAIVRPAVYTHGAGNVLAFTSSLGYKLKHETYKRGFVFTRGIVSAFMYQLDMIDVETMKPEKAPVEATWTIEARTPPTDTNVGPSIQALLELRALMKGLVDLERFRLDG